MENKSNEANIGIFDIYTRYHKGEKNVLELIWKEVITETGINDIVKGNCNKTKREKFKDAYSDYILGNDNEITLNDGKYKEIDISEIDSIFYDKDNIDENKKVNVHLIICDGKLNRIFNVWRNIYTHEGMSLETKIKKRFNKKISKEEFDGVFQDTLFEIIKAPSPIYSKSVKFDIVDNISIYKCLKYVISEYFNTKYDDNKNKIEEIYTNCFNDNTNQYYSHSYSDKECIGDKTKWKNWKGNQLDLVDNSSYIGIYKEIIMRLDYCGINNIKKLFCDKKRKIIDYYASSQEWLELNDTEIAKQFGIKKQTFSEHKLSIAKELLKIFNLEKDYEFKKNIKKNNGKRELVKTGNKLKMYDRSVLMKLIYILRSISMYFTYMNMKKSKFLEIELHKDELFKLLFNNEICISIKELFTNNTISGECLSFLEMIQFLGSNVNESHELYKNILEYIYDENVSLSMAEYMDFIMLIKSALLSYYHDQMSKYPELLEFNENVLIERGFKQSNFTKNYWWDFYEDELNLYHISQQKIKISTEPIHRHMFLKNYKIGFGLSGETLLIDENAKIYFVMDWDKQFHRISRRDTFLCEYGYLQAV